MKKMLNLFGLWMVTSAVMLAVVVVVQAQTRPLKVDNRPDPVVSTYLDDVGNVWTFIRRGEVIEVVFPVWVQWFNVNSVCGSVIAFWGANMNEWGPITAPCNPGGNIGFGAPDDRIVSVHLIGGDFSDLTWIVGGARSAPPDWFVNGEYVAMVDDDGAPTGWVVRQ